MAHGGNCGMESMDVGLIALAANVVYVPAVSFILVLPGLGRLWIEVNHSHPLAAHTRLPDKPPRTS